MNGFIAHGALIMLAYSCCLDAPMPSPLKSGRLVAITSVKAPPLTKQLFTASHERKFAEKKPESSRKYDFAEL
jgi:hypothetical protein